MDNGFRPAGLVPLSTTTLSVPTGLIGYNTIGTCTATHRLTLYRAPSGALVFGAGTVQWSWGLDANHAISGTPTDPNMQQATVNLLADIGSSASDAGDWTSACNALHGRDATQIDDYLACLGQYGGSRLNCDYF